MPPGAPILFPSGEDANPLHKRLPAEVVTRKPRQAKAVEEKVVDEVKVDLKSAVTLKPDARPKWLSKACKMAEENKASTTELYNIVTSRKFVSGLPPRIGKKLRDIVHENLELFSDRQQRCLKSDEWVLNGRFAERAEDGEPLDGLKDGPIPGDGSDVVGSADRDSSRDDRPKSRKDVSDEPQVEKWVTVAGGRGQEERLSREQTLAEERAKRKAQEREEQERWMQAEVEASRKKAQEQQEAKKRQLENEVDDSMMLLEQLAGGAAGGLPPVHRQNSDRSSGGRRHGLSRSRSVRVRSRSRRRRRRRSESAGRPKVDFADALRRRMEEREANDTTRIPVVDPGHAARWAARDTRTA